MGDSAQIEGGIGLQKIFWANLLGRFPDDLLNGSGCFVESGEPFLKSNRREMTELFSLLIIDIEFDF